MEMTTSTNKKELSGGGNMASLSSQSHPNGSRSSSSSSSSNNSSLSSSFTFSSLVPFTSNSRPTDSTSEMVIDSNIHPTTTLTPSTLTSDSTNKIHQSYDTPPLTSIPQASQPLFESNVPNTPPLSFVFSSQPFLPQHPSPFISSTPVTSSPRIHLFDVSLPSKLEINQVYWNGLHTLHRFEIKNVTSEPIRVKLKSNMGSQIAFQLSNENLPELDSKLLFHPNFSSTSTFLTSNSPLLPSPPPPPLPPQLPSHLYSSPYLKQTKENDFFNKRSPLYSTSLSTTNLEMNELKSTTDLESSSDSIGPSTSDPFFSSHSFFTSTEGLESYSPYSSRSVSASTSFPSDTLAESSNLSTVFPAMHPLPMDSSPSPSKVNTSLPPSPSFSSSHLPPIPTPPSVPPPPSYSPTGSLFQYISTTNTATAAALGAYASSHGGYEFNQLFNYVNHIDELRLEPYETRPLILTILPSLVSTHSPPTEETLVSETSSTFDFQEMNGMLLFYGYKLVPMNPPNSKPDCQIPIKFKARICKSVLWTEIAHQGLLFEECLVNSTVIRDFTIWNKSEIDLYFVLNTAEVPACLTFTNYNTGELLDTTKRIVAYSYCRVRVTYKPTLVGDFVYEVQLENVNDASNVEVIRIHCVVRSSLNEASLIVIGGNSLDFGDVCAGQYHVSKLVLKNVTENTLDIHLSAEGAKVLFNVMHSQQEEVTDILDSNISTKTKEAMSTEPSPVPLSLGLKPSTPVPEPPLTLSSPKMNGSPYNPTLSIAPIHSARSISLDSSVNELVRNASVFQSNGHGIDTDEDYIDSDSASSSSSRSQGTWGTFFPGLTNTPPRHTYQTSNLTDSHYRAPHHIDEIALKPGLERTVFVSYYPEKSVQEDYNAACLVKKTFRILLQHGKERKVIQCKARVCTSFITVGPRILSFGDTDVGTLKSLPIKITNSSEIQARIHLSFSSKVLSCPTNEILIPQRQSIQVKIDIFPRKVNPDYRKEITVVNLLNRDNNQIVEVRSTNLDTQRITWHSLFYRIMTPSSTNYLDFGSVVGNFFTLRTFTIQNVSKKNLVLAITSSNEQLSLYYKNIASVTTTAIPPTTVYTLPSSPAPSAIKDKKQVFENMADRKTIKRTNSDTIPNTTPDYLDLALPKRQQPVKPVLTSAYDFVHSIDEVIRVLQRINISSMATFQPPSMEHKFVKLVTMLKESLNSSIQDQVLLPLPPTISVPADSEMTFIAILRAPMITERRKKFEGRLNFALVEYDAELLPKVHGHLPVREFLTRCVLCPCTMEVAQRNINFGTVELQSELRKAIVIRNKSDVPLLFSIKKSGSIASGDLVIDHRLGMIPPHGSREVIFVFQPSMSGLYLEKITVENVQNPENAQTVCIKANVKKSHTFNIHTEAIDFGRCSIQELSAIKFITLQNTDKRQPHLFTVRVQEDHLLQFEFSVLSSEAMQHNTEDVEDKLESLEQKLKIAKRKGHQDKVEKINEEITELRRNELVVSAFQEDPICSPLGSCPPINIEKKVDSLTLLVEPNTLKKITVQVRPKPLPQFSSLESNSQLCQGFIYIHQHKNTDILKKVAYSCLVCYEPTLIHLPSIQEASSVLGQTTLLPSLVPTSPSSEPMVTGYLPIPESLDVLALETESVDLGKFVLHQEAPFYFVLINRHSTEPKSYYIPNVNVVVKEREGVVLPSSRKIIHALFVPSKSGKQTFRVEIVSVDTCLFFTFHYLGVYKDALLLKRGSQVIQDIDLGYCYNSKKSVAREALHLHSTVGEPIKVSALSTLIQQAAVFLDEASSAPLIETMLAPNQSIPVYLTVQPNLMPLPMTPLKKGAPSCGSRQLVGGFKFTGTNSSGDEVCTQNVRFQAIIGHSVFQVSPTYLNLGFVDTLKPVNVSFTISNLSDKMPLRFSVTSSSPEMITIQNDSACLVGYEDETTSNVEDASSSSTNSSTLPSNERALSTSRVHVTLNPPKMGYYHEKLWITNIHCPELTTTIQTSFFLDPQRLLLTTSSDLFAVPDCLETHSFPLLQWEHVHVYLTPENEVAPAESTFQENKELSLTNTTDYILNLFSQCNVEGVQVRITSHLAMEPPIVTRVSSDISEPLVWTRCSPYLSLNPGETMRCSVTAPFPPSAVSEESLLTLNQGKKIKTRGILTFCNLSNSETQVLKVVELQAYFGIAKGEVLQTKAIQLKAKRGECINFITPIKNVSLCPLHLTLHAPSFLRFQKSTSTSTSFESIDWNHSLIPTAQTVDLSFTLDTTELTGGTHEWTILLKNAHNPFNDMSIPVSASITCLDLTIFGGDLDENNVLCLPSVWIPNLNPDITCDAWFNLTNMSVNEVRFTVSVELIQPVADLIQLLVLSRFSNSPLNWLTLPPNGSIEVKVKVLVLDNAKFTSLSPKWMLDERGVQLGKVFVENENGIVTIPVRGKLMEKICFDVDVSVLEVKIDVLSELHLTNLSQHHPLTLSTHLELLHELDSVHLHLPSLVHLNPSSVYTLPLKLEKSEFLESGDILWIHFTDLESVEGMKKSVKLRLREINDTLEPPSSNLLSVHPVFSPMLSQTGGSDLAPLEEEVLVVKGCTKKDKLYELDLGQQDLGTPSLTRKLSIELHQPLACRFVIKTVPSDTSDWLTLSKSEGQLDPVTQKSQILLLTFNLSVRNAYFSYIVIENLDYPSDIKWVKVSLEVVSKANPKKMRPFDLVCHGFNNNSIPVLRYEDVYYGTEYITRSFRIYNRESIPVEFSFNVQNLSPQDETQVLFSSSASSPVLVKEVIVMPESSYHVYLRFCPAPGSLDLNPELMETKIFEIQVHSRLIRDYLQTLQVIATCWFPRIKVSSSKLLFNIDPHFSHYTHLDAFISSSSTTTSPNSTFATSPVHSPKPFSSSINPYAVNLLQQKDFLQNFSKELIISNLHLSRYVPVIILNDAFFFEVNTTQEGLVDEVDSVHPYSIPTYTNSTHSLTSSSTVNQNSFPITPPSMTSLEQELQPGQHFSLRVRVKIDVVWSWLDRLKREKYIEESIMVYHHRYPTEHFVVSLKLSLGLLHDFAFSRWSTWPSTSSPSSSFLSLTKWLSLEYQIYQFLRQLPSSDPLLLAFPFHIIVDQLVYYATTMTGPTDSIFLLAFLLWSTVKNFSTDTALLDNQKYLGYFLSFFPPPSYIHPFPPLLENLQKLFLSSQPSSTVIPSTLS